VVCEDTGEQLILVPGAVGSSASGTGANVVSGAAGWVVVENGLGPLSGDTKIVPGVDESPMAVVPMVETCAMQALLPNSRAAANRCRIAIISSVPVSLSAPYAL
jgi:methylglyoxal synthase